MYIEKSIPLLCKKPSLNLHRGTLVPEKQVKRDTRHWQDDVCMALGTAEVPVANTHYKGSNSPGVSILI